MRTKKNVRQVEERWVWSPDAGTCRIKIAHPTKLNQYDQYLMTRANLDWLADPAPGGYPGWRGSTRRSVPYTRRTSLSVGMSCRRVERHTGFYWSPSIRLMGTDPEWRGYIRTLASTAGNRNWYTGQPSSPKAMLCIFQSLSVFIFFLYFTALDEFAIWGSRPLPFDRI